MKRLMTLIVLAGLMVSGCASSKLCKAGATRMDFERDKYYCDMKTRSGSGEMLLVDLDHWFNCMRIEKGWSKCPE